MEIGWIREAQIAWTPSVIYLHSMNSGVRFFPSIDVLRKWFASRHQAAQELWIGFYNRKSGKKSVSYKEALDEALCTGWIDGIRKNLDEESYTIRFTPRKKGSIWSNVNTKRAEELIREGRMLPAGLKAFGSRDEKKAGIYSFEQPPRKLSPAYEKKFRAQKKAWTFFTAQAPWYQRTAIHLVMSAKQEATRIRRLEALIDHSGKQETIPQLTRFKK